MNHPFTPPESEDDPRDDAQRHEAERYWTREVIEQRAAQLVADAEALGFRVTIENVSDKPLAMRNYPPAIHVYESRK